MQQQWYTKFDYSDTSIVPQVQSRTPVYHTIEQALYFESLKKLQVPFRQQTDIKMANIFLKLKYYKAPVITGAFELECLGCTIRGRRLFAFCIRATQSRIHRPVYTSHTWFWRFSKTYFEWCQPVKEGLPCGIIVLPILHKDNSAPDWKAPGLTNNQNGL